MTAYFFRIDGGARRRPQRETLGVEDSHKEKKKRKEGREKRACLPAFPKQHGSSLPPQRLARENPSHFLHALPGFSSGAIRAGGSDSSVLLGEEGEEEEVARWGPDLSSRCWPRTSTCSPGTGFASPPLFSPHSSDALVLGSCIFVARRFLVGLSTYPA